MVRLPFFKKKSEQVLPGKGFVPNDRVREMASRGFSEPEMIDVLRREGFSPEEIDSALTSALRQNVTGEVSAVQQTAAETTRELQSPTASNILPSLTPTGPSAQVAQQEVMMPQVPETSLPEDYYSSYSTEDYIDYAVQSKLEDVNGILSEMQKKQKELSAAVEELQKKIESSSTTKGDVASETLSKMERFVETISDVDSRVGGLEKAFKETLPALIEGVRTLSDVVQKVKKEG